MHAQEGASTRNMFASLAEVINMHQHGVGLNTGLLGILRTESGTWRRSFDSCAAATAYHSSLGVVDKSSRRCHWRQAVPPLRLFYRACAATTSACFPVLHSLTYYIDAMQESDWADLISVYGFRLVPTCRVPTEQEEMHVPLRLLASNYRLLCARPGRLLRQSIYPHMKEGHGGQTFASSEADQRHAPVCCPSTPCAG